jgi:hypothetical protein
LETDELDDLTRAAVRRWGHVEELLALVLEQIVALHQSFIKANSDPKRSTRTPKPYRYPRPNDERSSRNVVGMSDMARLLTKGGRRG